MKCLYIFGAGDHGRKAYHYALAGGWERVVFVDDARRDSPPIPGVDLIASRELPVPGDADRIFVAIGARDARRRVTDRLADSGWTIATLVHPAASVAPDAVLEAGVLVAAGAVVETGAVVERGAIVDIGALVDHDCRVGAFTHLRPGAVLPPRTVHR